MAAGKITLTSIQWTTPPDTPKRVTVSYKLASAPDVPASYQIVTTSAFVDVTGFFFTPVVINGLNTDLSYTVKVVSSCGGYSFMKDFTFVPDGFAFSLGFSVGFDA